MTIYTEHRIITVPVHLQTDANAVAYVLDPQQGGALTFIVGISAAGQWQITHYVCSTLYTPQTVALLDDPDATGMHAALQAMAADRGREYTISLGQLQALRDVLDIAATPLAEFMGERDLQFVQEVSE